MTLIIGGAGQGKLSYALEKTGAAPRQVSCDPRVAAPVVTGLEVWLRREESPMEALEMLIQQQPDVVILCDEVGSGVVPLAQEDRTWRERVGRTCCALAERASCVVRIWCGIPMVLKGETPWN